MTIENFGVGARCAEALRLLLAAEQRGEISESVKRILLLPIPTSRDKIHLSGTDRLLCEIFSDARCGDLIIGYGIDAKTKSQIKSRGALVYDALDDEDFLLENARQTALGALGYVLSTMDRVPSDLSFSVVGYGRIGTELVRLLLFLGAKVKVYTGREMTCIELGECGVKAHLVPRGTYPDFDSDVIINTAPADLSKSFKRGKIPSGVRVIELASGENFSGIEGVERLPGIPDKYYGKSAGAVYYSKIMKFLSEVTK